MRWVVWDGNPWRKRFALLPLRVLNLTGSGPYYNCGWLCWYWTRSDGDGREVTFNNPNTADAGCRTGERAMTDLKLPEAVAARYDGDGYGYHYIDNGSGSSWLTRHADAEPLYTAAQLQAYATAAVRAEREGRPNVRWWANGPQGSFFGSDEVLIEDLIRAGVAHFGWDDDDWTMTDMKDHDDAC